MTVLFVVLVALAPGVASWWSGRRLEGATNDPALPELLLARSQRIVPIIATALALLIVFGGGHLYLGLTIVCASLLASGYPLRRALGIEVSGFGRYLWRSFKSIVGSVGFWILLALTPQIVLALEPRFRPAALLLFPLLLLWERWYARLWLWLHDSAPFSSDVLAPRIATIVERAGIRAPALYRIGAPDARFTNAFAFPALDQSAIGLGNTLIELLEPDEAVAIYAHELAHIEAFGPRRIRRLQLLNRLLIALALALPFALLAWAPNLVSWLPAVWPLVVIASLILRARTRQAEEHESDLRAAALCGDPEAVVRGLIKVHVHGFLPRRWPIDFERYASHPSLARQIQALRGEAAPATAPGAAVVLPTAREGSVVVFDDARGHWFDGVPAGTRHDLESLRATASSARSVAWNDLVELRLTAQGGSRALKATHRNGDTWSVPLDAEQVVDVQRALDVVDVRLHRELGKRPLVTVRALATVAALALLLTQQYGIVLLPAALALVWPGTAAAAALGVAALLRAALSLALGEAPEFFISPLIATTTLVAIGVAASWIAWRGYRTERKPASDRITAGALAAVAALSVATLVLGAGSSNVFTPLTTLAVASGGLAAALAVSSARWARWTAGASAVLALIAGTARVRVERGDSGLTSVTATVQEEGRIGLEGSISDLRLSPDGHSYVIPRFVERTTRRQPNVDFLVGGFGGAQRVIEALDVRFGDDQHVLALRYAAGDSLLLQLERADRDSVLWSIPLPELLDPRLASAPGEKSWTVVGELPTDSFFVGSGTLSSRSISARSFASFDESGTAEVLVFDGGTRIIATTFDTGTPVPAALVMFGMGMPKLATWSLGPEERKRVGEFPGYPQCGPPDSGRAVCFVRTGGRGRVYSLGADGIPLSHGSLRGTSAAYMMTPSPGRALTVTDRATRVLHVQPEAGKVVEITLPAASGFVMTANVAADRLAVVRQDSASAQLVWYRVRPQG